MLYWAGKAATALLMALVLFLPLLASAENVWKNGDYGRIITNGAGLYSSIKEDREWLTSLEEGTAIQVMQVSEPWLLVNVNGQQGWLNENLVRKPWYYDDQKVAVVQNPNASDRLNLRKKPNSKADSLGKYYNGTYAVILEDSKTQKEWTHVRIGEVSGYMKTEFLAFGAEAEQAASAQPEVTISNQSGKGLNLRVGQNEKSKIIRLLDNGTKVTVLGVAEDWLHVQIGDQTGYIKSNGVTPRINYSYAVETAKKGTITKPCSVYQAPFTDPQDADRLLAGVYDTGDTVTVYSDHNGWAQVSYGNKKYYVPSDCIAVKEDKKNEGAIQKGSIIRPCSVYKKPYLESREADDLLIGVYDEGDIVTVYQISNGWVQVSYGNARYWIQASDIKLLDHMEENGK